MVKKFVLLSAAADVRGQVVDSSPASSY